jgi:two-component system, OmpR family, manganese sensing sensor histidine kinase
MFQATRLRLAIWYTTVTAVLLLIFAGGFYSYVRLTLIDRIDDTIAHVVEVLERSLISQSLNLSTDLGNNLEADHIDMEWFSPKGEMLVSTLPPSINFPLDLSLNTSNINKGRYRTVYPANQEPLRQFTKTVIQNGNLLGYLRVSHPWFEVTKPIKQLLFDLAIGVSVMLAIVGICGWWLSALAIKPLKESYQQLKQFTADVSHELRNPVAVIQTNVQVALADPFSDWQTQQRQLEVIERLTRRLGRLLDDLLFLARHEGGISQVSLQTCDLHESLERVIEEQRIFSTAKEIEISVNSGSENYSVQANPDRLERLLTNLLSNAIAYTPNQGKITISLTRFAQSVQLKIQDSGIGIAKEDLPHIFERFWHRSSYPGSGLGLAIVKAIAEADRTQIKVESTEGKGTSFNLLFNS